MQFPGLREPMNLFAEKIKPDHSAPGSGFLHRTRLSSMHMPTATLCACSIKPLTFFGLPKTTLLKESSKPIYPVLELVDNDPLFFPPVLLAFSALA